MLQIRRNRFNSVVSSPLATLYGRANSYYVASLEIIKPSGMPAAMIGATVSSSGIPIGLIERYTQPIDPGELVNPIVLIRPLSPLDTSILDVSVSSSPSISIGDNVRLMDAPLSIRGTVKHVLVERAWPAIGFKVKCHEIIFNTNLQNSHHGTPVLKDSGELVGMLFSTKNRASGESRTLIYPSELV